MYQRKKVIFPFESLYQHSNFSNRFVHELQLIFIMAKMLWMAVIRYCLIPVVHVVWFRFIVNNTNIWFKYFIDTFNMQYWINFHGIQLWFSLLMKLYTITTYNRQCPQIDEIVSIFFFLFQNICHRQLKHIISIFHIIFNLQPYSLIVQ